MINGELLDDNYICGVRKVNWALNNQDLKRLNYFKDILESIEPVKFKILEKSSGVYKLVPIGSLKYMVDKYKNLFYYQKDCNVEGDKYKIVPNCILNASKEIKIAYWKGYYDSAKTCGKSVDNPSFATKGKIGAQCLYYLMHSIGYNMGIDLYNHPKKQEIYLSQTTFKTKKETNVKKIELQDQTNDYVYDLETDIGRFQAGIGDIIVKNTDSIFLRMKFNRDDFDKNRSDTFKLATICGDKITDELFKKPPIVLEFEKVFQPFILLTKKRYIAKKYEDMKDPFKLKCIDSKGTSLIRRDYCQMVKNCYKEIIDKLLEIKDTSDKSLVNESIIIFKKYIDDIHNYRIPIDDLVLSAMLAASYKTRPVHVVLAEKLKERNEEASIGDRIQYIFIESDDPKIKKSELGEDPDYAKRHNLKYNRKCYTDQLSKSVVGLYKVILIDDIKKLDELIEYINKNMISYGAKPFKHSDFKIEDK